MVMFKTPCAGVLPAAGATEPVCLQQPVDERTWQGSGRHQLLRPPPLLPLLSSPVFEARDAQVAAEWRTLAGVPKVELPWGAQLPGELRASCRKESRGGLHGDWCGTSQRACHGLQEVLDADRFPRIRWSRSASRKDGH